MPIISSCILTQASAVFFFLGLVPAVVVTSAPTNADVYAVCGAMIATAIAALDALLQKKNMLTIAIVILSSSGIGAIGPGAAVSIASIVLPAEWQRWIPGITWNVWGTMGVVFGLFGMGIVRGLMNISRKRLPDLVEEQVDRIPRVKKPGNGSLPLIALLIIPWCLVCCTSTTTTTQIQPSGKQVVTVVKKEPSPAIMPLLGALVEPGYGAVVAVGGKLISYVTGWMSSKPKTTAPVP